MTPVLELSAHLLEQAEGIGWAAFLVFVRVGAAMALLPVFGEASVPMRVRLVVTLAFTLVMTPMVAPGITSEPSALPILAEAAVGLLLGSGFRILVLTLQTAGAMAAQAVSLSQIFGGVGVEPQPAIGHLLTIAGLALAASLGLHVHVAHALILSYDLLPAGRFPAASDVGTWGLAQVSRSFALAFTLAAPFVIASLIYNVALGVINRAMPQLMVAFVGAPALTAGGLMLLALVVPTALAVWVTTLQAYLANPFAVGP